jgi:hypothetical protein
MIIMSFGKGTLKMMEHEVGYEVQKQRRDGLGRFQTPERWIIIDREKVEMSRRNHHVVELHRQLGLL